jgi:hypothetical protein
MLRKLSEGLSSAGDRIASALAGGSSSSAASASSQPDGEADKVRRLAALGFGEAEASRALRAAGGDADRAAELLLAPSVGAPASPAGGGGPTAGLGGGDDDEVMRRVLQQSVDDENRRRHQQQSAASRRAGDAALARAEARNRPKTPTTTAASRAKKPPGQRPSSPAKAAPSPAAAAGPSGPLASHHPGVKVVPKLQDKSKEERVVRCADRLRGSPGAVDALHRALSTIRDNPGDEKYRTVDKSSAGYKRALEGAPGAEEMLLAMSFRRVRSSGGDGTNSKLVLDRSMVDPALLYLGISALEQVKLSDEYRRGKQAIEFSRELGEALTGGDSSESEAVERSRFLGLCPSEPPPGRGAVVQVRLADRGAVRRRFDADDTLGDVLNWLGAHGSDIPRRVASREWSLVDLSHYPVSPFDPAADAPLTLQYLGCWPSGKLELLPSTDEWRGGGKTARRTSRGLGSAPSDAL